MPGEKKVVEDSSSGSGHYLFKVTIVGPDDSLLAETLRMCTEKVVAVDGIKITSTKTQVDGSDVRTVMMSPGREAQSLLLSLTFKGATAAIIVMRDADPEVEAHYRNEIREKIGAGYPTRVFLTGPRVTTKKKQEFLRLLDELTEEMLLQRKAKTRER
ncbi:MAG: hypothetical protein HXY34_11470 [Candidatus Thorarchaeota archaeon]|nr:hypothetical protein [Candidatus Thorarchaeota archaeon]